MLLFKFAQIIFGVFPKSILKSLVLSQFRMHPFLVIPTIFKVPAADVLQVGIYGAIDRRRRSLFERLEEQWSQEQTDFTQEAVVAQQVWNPQFSERSINELF